MNKKEKLLPELRERVFKKGPFGKMIGHPFVHEPMYIPAMNAMYNRQFLAKKEAAKKAVDEKNWHTYVWLHERPYRLEAFMDIHDDVDDKNYWELLHDIWIDSENIWQYLDAWKMLLKSERSGKGHFMDEDEKNKFESIPETVTVYRGHQKHNKDGLSYTLSKSKAEWFAGRFRKNEAQVKQITVQKSQIFAYVERGDEQEVIVLEDL